MARPVSLVLAALAVAAGVVGAPQAAFAGVPIGGSASTSVTGYDASFPQCGALLPGGQAFAVVGVNDGLATTTNPCLADELAWADASTGITGQPASAVYVNTANPGHLGSWWPSADRTRQGVTITSPYGSCSGGEDAACAYVYGASLAFDDAFARGVPDPAGRLWWLDVETTNTWSPDGSANQAVLEGMTGVFTGIGARVGIYSTHRQWAEIAGAGPTLPGLQGLPDWLSGATTPAGARASCATAPLTPGGRVVLAQWVSGTLDGDLDCGTPDPTDSGSGMRSPDAPGF